MHGAWEEDSAATLLCGHVGARCEHLSPTLLAGTHSPRTLLYHGTHDEFYSVTHANALRRALQVARVPHAVLTLPLVPHACEGGEHSWPAQLVRYALDHMLRSVLGVA